jgi:hypothetical protein
VGTSIKRRAACAWNRARTVFLMYFGCPYIYLSVTRTVQWNLLILIPGVSIRSVLWLLLWKRMCLKFLVAVDCPFNSGTPLGSKAPLNSRMALKQRSVVNTNFCSCGKLRLFTILSNFSISSCDTKLHFLHNASKQEYSSACIPQQVSNGSALSATLRKWIIAPEACSYYPEFSCPMKLTFLILFPTSITVSNQ